MRKLPFLPYAEQELTTFLVPSGCSLSSVAATWLFAALVLRQGLPEFSLYCKGRYVLPIGGLLGQHHLLVAHPPWADEDQLSLPSQKRSDGGNGP